MISYSNFQNFLQEAFLYPCKIEAQGFIPHYSTEPQNFEIALKTQFLPSVHWPLGKCIFWHEEPIDLVKFKEIMHWPLYANYGGHELRNYICEYDSIGMTHPMNDICIQILANSEKSKEKNTLCKTYNFLDWYFFFHGFAALDWFRDFRFLQNNHYQIDKVFICLNHLLEEKRNYRLLLLSKLKFEKLLPHGYVSASKLSDSLLRSELANPHSFLSKNAKKHIMQNLMKTPLDLKLDEVDSKTNGTSILPYSYRAFWHVVTETVFFEDKLHLTEKIFKPIVVKRPFILCGSVNNLEYLKSYGFKTFDRWIDESYDKEPDPERRIELITNQLKKLCSLSKSDLNKMYQEMLPTLEHNYNFFYNDFYKVLTDELIYNFQTCLKQYNLGRFTDRYFYPESLFDVEKISSIFN